MVSSLKRGTSTAAAAPSPQEKSLKNASPDSDDEEEEDCDYEDLNELSSLFYSERDGIDQDEDDDDSGLILSRKLWLPFEFPSHCRLRAAPQEVVQIILC